ncbi:DJ-1 family protein [archaeon]|nr:MAG: DJ-1 family protein [archaeon]
MLRGHSGGPSVTKHVLVPIATGSEEVEAVTIIDTLVRGGAKVTVAGVGSELTVTCSRGVKIVADCLISDCANKSWDMIVCPGGMPGAQHLSESHTLIEILQKHAHDNKFIAAICAAPAVVLAAHGFLTNKTATCYPVSKFTAKIERYVSQRVVQDGQVITSEGPGTALEFSLKLVQVLYGHEKAEQIKNEMLA